VEVGQREAIVGLPLCVYLSFSEIRWTIVPPVSQCMPGQAGYSIRQGSLQMKHVYAIDFGGG
jgi:hypothetical protein